MHSLTYLLFMSYAAGLAIPGGLFMPCIMVGSSFGLLVGAILQKVTNSPPRARAPPQPPPFPPLLPRNRTLLTSTPTHNLSLSLLCLVCLSVRVPW